VNMKVVSYYFNSHTKVESNKYSFHKLSYQFIILYYHLLNTSIMV